jgi:hypothetical protein
MVVCFRGARRANGVRTLKTSAVRLRSNISYRRLLVLTATDSPGPATKVEL